MKFIIYLSQIIKKSQPPKKTTNPKKITQKMIDKKTRIGIVIISLIIIIGISHYISQPEESWLQYIIGTSISILGAIIVELYILDIIKNNS